MKLSEWQRQKSQLQKLSDVAEPVEPSEPVEPPAAATVFTEPPVYVELKIETTP